MKNNMEKYDLNEGNEALNRVLLMMKYNNKKTLTENKKLLSEEMSEDDYFEYKIQQILEHPETHKTFVTKLTDKGKLVAKAINESVSGLGTNLKGVNHSIDKGFSTLEELVGISKYYKETYGNSLYSDLRGEVFSLGLSRITDKGVELAKKTCITQTPINKKWCTPTSVEQQKYGF